MRRLSVCPKSLFENSSFGDSGFAASVVHTFNVDTQAARPDGQNHPEHYALPRLI